MLRVFISYAREDADVREFLRANLAAAGIEVFVDTTIDPGATWPVELERNIRMANAVAVVMTPASFQSEWVRNECGFAVVQGIPILPLLARGDERTSVPMQFVHFHRIDLRADPMAGVHALVATLTGQSVAGPVARPSLQMRTHEFAQVAKYPSPAWRWSAWISAPPAVQHEVNKEVLRRLQVRSIKDVRVGKKDQALAKASGISRSLFGGDITIGAAVFPTPQSPAVQHLVVQAVTTNWVMRRDQVRELVQQFALTTAGLVVESGGVVLPG